MINYVQHMISLNHLNRLKQAKRRQRLKIMKLIRNWAYINQKTEVYQSNKIKSKYIITIKIISISNLSKGYERARRKKNYEKAIYWSRIFKKIPKVILQDVF